VTRAFAGALFDEAATLFPNGQLDLARPRERDRRSRNAGREDRRVCQELLSHGVGKTAIRCLDNLAAIISVLRRTLGIELDARSVEAAK
jgi:hypothetical protein